MQTKKDISCGIIPIKKFAGEWKVFLIHQYSRISKNTYWILPKGHPEEGETYEETAMRELFEETGMTYSRLIKEPTFELKYKFMFDGVQIDKQVIYFVGIIEEENIVLQEGEVVEAGWYTLEEATERLDYKNAKDMFTEAKKFILTL